MSEPTTAASIFEWARKIKPPRFDRIAVHDLRPFNSIPRREHAPSFGALAGIPVIVDEDVEVGVIELRKGDEVVERLHLSELRA